MAKRIRVGVTPRAHIRREHPAVPVRQHVGGDRMPMRWASSPRTASLAHLAAITTGTVASGLAVVAVTVVPW